MSKHIKKYARIIYGPQDYRYDVNKKPEDCNAGDYFQTFAIDSLYRLAGIDNSDVIDIHRSELSSYSGESVFLPMQGWFGPMKGVVKIFPLSSKITPIFIGFQCYSLSDEDAVELRRYAPIGCRDEATYLQLRKKKVPAFISGCMTLTLQPSLEGKKDKAIFIDVHPDVLKEAPEEISGNCMVMSNNIKITDEVPIEEAPLYYERKSRELLDFYEKHASLIVSNRLHCTGPALALGIPVILITNKKRNPRFTFIDKYTKIYELNHISKMDWNVAALDIDKEKELLTNFALSSIRKGKVSNHYREVHKLYIKRQFNTVRLYYIVKTNMPELLKKSMKKLCQRRYWF